MINRYVEFLRVGNGGAQSMSTFDMKVTTRASNSMPADLQFSGIARSE